LFLAAGIQEMIYKDLKIEYDKDRVVKEILSCKDLYIDIPPYKFWLELAKNNKIFMVETLERYDSISLVDNNKIVKKSIDPPKSFYIRSSNFNNNSYLQSKKITQDPFFWNNKIGNRLDYTRVVIESLPFLKIGLVRAFITENTFLPTHHDAINTKKIDNLGVSLVPIHSNTPLMVYNTESRNIESIFSSCFLFDDSYLHGIPMTNGLRIDIRVFGILKENNE